MDADLNESDAEVEYESDAESECDFLGEPVFIDTDTKRAFYKGVCKSLNLHGKSQNL